MYAHGDLTQHGKPRSVEACDLQPVAREGWAGPFGVTERPIVPVKSGNADGGKGPWFKVNAGRDESRESGDSLIPPVKAQKPQMALHAKAKGAALMAVLLIAHT
jgi:hypothetical protein